MAVGWNCTNSMSRSTAPRAGGERETRDRPRRADWWWRHRARRARRSPAPPARAGRTTRAGCAHPGNAGDGAVGVAQQRGRPHALHQMDRRAGAHGAGERLQHRAAGGIAAGMDDAPARMRGLQPECDAALSARGRTAHRGRRASRSPPAPPPSRGAPPADRRARRRRFSVSTAWSSGWSSSPMAAAMPPCAQAVAASRPRSALASSVTGTGARRSAVASPATPPPITTT